MIKISILQRPLNLIRYLLLLVLIEPLDIQAITKDFQQTGPASGYQSKPVRKLLAQHKKEQPRKHPGNLNKSHSRKKRLAKIPLANNIQPPGTFYTRSLFRNRANDTISFNIIRRDSNKVTRYSVNGLLMINDLGLFFSLKDSLVLNYKKWILPANNRISYTSSGISATNFTLINDSSAISVTNRSPLAASPVDVIIQNFDMRNMAGFFNKDSFMFTGLLNAKFALNEFDQVLTELTGIASINNLALMQQPLGNFQMNLGMPDKNTVHATMNSSDSGSDITAGGNFYLNDSLHQVEALLDIRKLPLLALQGLAKGKIRFASGNINGSIALKGRIKRPEWNGALNIDTTNFSLTSLGTFYSAKGQKITFLYPQILFKQFTIADTAGHPFVIDGSISARPDTAYDLALHLDADDFSIINTTRAIDNQLYGYAAINAKLSVTGNAKRPVVEGNIHLNDKTRLTIILPEKNSDRDEARSAVRFVNRNIFSTPEEAGTLRPSTAANSAGKPFLNNNLNIFSDKQASLTIIIDPSTGDELTVKGYAKLNPAIKSGGSIVSAGTYVLDSGYYELNYEFLKKRFNIVPGSTLSFNGGPTDAQMNIRAVYIANTSPKDLLGNEVGSISSKMARSFNQKLPFTVTLILKGSFKNPAISFDIRLPEDNTISRQLRTTIENKLIQVRADETSMNKQVFAILVLGRFVGEQSVDFFKGNDNGKDFSDIARESVSQFLAAALDQVASDLFTGINIDLNLKSYKDFNTSDVTGKTDLNVEVSKNFLDDRLNVTVGKNFGIESQDGSTKASQQKASRFLPDVTVNYKLSGDGKYMIRGYSKNPFEVILDGYIIETGVAFIVTMDYEKFTELFMKGAKKPMKN